MNAAGHIVADTFETVAFLPCALLSVASRFYFYIHMHRLQELEC